MIVNHSVCTMCRESYFTYRGDEIQGDSKYQNSAKEKQYSVVVADVRDIQQFPCSLRHRTHVLM